uniref:F-actin monooxygenase n=1 Tax=Scleropages formosus TaxID=113540 RepID=A0A8C9WIJ4_SCLFO
MGDGCASTGGERVNHSHVLFDRFVQASTCKGTLKAFQELCDFLELKPNEYRIFYHKLKSRLNYWKAKALWAKLDKRGSHKDYKKGRACANSKCLIIGAGPCGLRTAIELAFLGAKVVLLEKRDAFSRNNVLHLWPFTIQDLRGLGAKKFYGKFCAGAIDHISIRQLQLMLLKVALLLGIEIHVNVEFKRLVEPPEDQERIGWRAEVHPRTHPVNELEFDVIIGADGRRNTLPGFRRKEFRGKLAIAITANFINRNTTAEAKVEEISGVAFIFNQKFFQDLREATGIDLENIVYYKDDTHYFVMTAKKQSLLDKGVILHDYADTELLLSRSNVDQAALLAYAREAADFSTNHQLPKLDFAINHYGQPDVAMFDFTCMYASENAALVRQRHGHQLLVALVGDSLLEPFWPMGTGIARGFLAAMDSAWMVRSWAQGRSPLEVLAERESIYRLLPQTTPENVSKNFSQYSVDPSTRYPNITLNLVGPSQVRHLVDTGEPRDSRIDMENVVNSSTPKLLRNESIARSSKLLSWCQRQTEGYRNVAVVDLTMSWKSGMALCALIHRFRPDLIDFDSLEEQNLENNNQLAFDVAEREFGICPIMTGKEMAFVSEPDKLSMLMYLSQFYEMFKDTNRNLSPEEKAALIASTKSPISFLSKLGQSISRKRNPKNKKEKDLDGVGKRRKTSCEDAAVTCCDEQPSVTSALLEPSVESSAEAAAASHTRVKSMATQLLARFEDSAPLQAPGLKRQSSLRKEFPQNIGGSDVCYFCRKRVYVMERLSAEGKFFHRSCFTCDYCGTTLRLSSYAFDLEDGKDYLKIHFSINLGAFLERKSLFLKCSTGPAPTVGTTISAPVNGVPEVGLAKRLRGTPERIELENYRLSLQREEELEEVPEETLAEHNLSSLLDKATDVEEGSRSVAQPFGAPCSRQSKISNSFKQPSISPVQPAEGIVVTQVEDIEEPEAVVCIGAVQCSLLCIVLEQVFVNMFFFSPQSPQKAHSPALDKSPETNFFPKLLIKEEVKPQVKPLVLQAESTLSPSPPVSPICSQPVPLPEAVIPKSPVTSKPCACSPTGSALSPICAQQLLCTEPSAPLSSDSPVRTPPSSVVASTPLTKPGSDKPLPEAQQQLDSSEEAPVKRADIIEEFWLKSAEIRRSLGLSPLERSRAPERTVKAPSPDSSSSPKSYTSEDQSEELKPPFVGRVVIRRLNITVEGQVITPVEREPKSSGSEKKDLSSSSGLGLNGSSVTSQTFNTSDSAMLTPPSSPPPPPPVAIKHIKHQVAWTNLPEDTSVPVQVPNPLTIPNPDSPRREEVRKSFVESVDEIPFADDVEDTYDDQTPDASMHDKFYTPHSNKPLQIKPPLHLALSMDSGKLGTVGGLASQQRRDKLESSSETKGVAEETVQARERSAKSQAFRDAMIRQLTKVKESEPPKDVSKGAWNISPELTGKGKKTHRSSSPPQMSAVKALESRKKGETQLAGSGSKSQDSSGVSSESSAGGKTKKRSSLFSPRKNKKDKKAKTDGRSSDKQGSDDAPKHKSLWKVVFSGYKKDKKKKKDDKSWSSTPSSAMTFDMGKRRSSSLERTLDYHLRKNLSFSEDSDLSCDDVLERSSQKSKTDVMYTEEELNAKLTRRVQKAARRQAKQEELKRLHRAQIIQRQLEQVEEKQRQLEERGVAVEKALRGEAGMGKKDDPKLMQEWFKLVQEKNALVRYESELMIFARELELEDRQSRLQQLLRERMAVEDHLKTEKELSEEKQILSEMLEVVEQRDALVALLEEQRLREKEEDKDLEAIMLSKGFDLNWV